MGAGLSPRQARARYRHDLRTLTYVTLDQGNGGVVRNLSHEGMGVQAVAALRPRQQVRVRFELRYPRLRVETRGEVTWATFSGQCGIRFLDLSPRMARQIDEWIFGSLLEGIALHSERAEPMFSGSVFAGATISGSVLAAEPSLARDAAEEDDGLMVSAAPVKVIELLARSDAGPQREHDTSATPVHSAAELDWLSQPLSGRSLIWTINGLVMAAALLLFALVFLSVNRELPSQPIAMAGVVLLVVGALYWGFFQWFGGASPGARLARLAGFEVEEEDEAADARFR
jgi:hypothetical protein